MAQGIFPARQELGFTPSTVVRANIDTRTGAGAVSAAIGQAGLAVGSTLQRIGEIRQANQDTRSTATANSFIDEAVDNNRTFRASNADTTLWEKDLEQGMVAAKAKIDRLPFSNKGRSLMEENFSISSRSAAASVLTATATREADDTRGAVILALVDAVKSGDMNKKRIANDEFDKAAPRLWDAAEGRKNKAVAVAAGERGFADNLINGVHAAMEAASQTGNFDIARQLATNAGIPEKDQTILRNAIKSAETSFSARAREAIQLAKDTATSQTLGEYFRDELTPAELDKRHLAGLIEDSEFKFMRQGLETSPPKNSDPFIVGEIRRITADFEAGDITRLEAETRIGEIYQFLDGPDRADVFANLEDIASKVIGTARTNAYNEGRGLMSVQFVGIRSADDLFALFALPGLSEEDKKRINRRWEAEIANRDLYERAVDDRFREMRKDKVTDTKQFQAESLRILQQYQRRKRLNLETLESAVRAEQQKIIAGKVGKDVPVDEMTTEEKQAELQRIRELKQLIR